jgi:histidinol-phosphate/aromatic aminotransferase/cobyric acid decarboxylase-like protein
MGSWGMPDYLRVTIGTAKENKRFIQSLKETL